MIERAYRLGDTLSLPVWCEDEAGPYQAIPQPGRSWQPKGLAARQPHEYVRGGTAKLLTLFRPATGEVRALPVERAPNTVLHPWLQQELTAILAALPALPADLPPLRLLLVLDNLTGHKSGAFVCWLLQHGIMPLYTPLSGSWLNLAESVQRILVRRALYGQHPETSAQVMAWLAAEVRGWNAHPTPFVWGGKRAARRQRAREQRHALGGAGGYTRRPIARSRTHAA